MREDPAWPGSATYRGVEQVRQVILDCMDTLDFSQQTEELVDAGDKVVVLVRWVGRGRASGAQGEISMAMVCRRITGARVARGLAGSRWGKFAGVTDLPQTDDAPLARISDRIVHLFKEYYGKGPNGAKTYFQDDLVVVLMRGGYTKVEDTLLEEGRSEAVKQQRMAFQEVMRPRFAEAIESELGLKVVAFMSVSHREPDLTAEVFLVESGNGDSLLDAQAGDGP